MPLEREDELRLRLSRHGARVTAPPRVGPRRVRLGRGGVHYTQFGARGRMSSPYIALNRQQRSTVKVSYTRRRSGRGAWAAHGSYLSREGAQREGQRGVGFDAERDDVDLRHAAQGWEDAGDTRLFKLIVSPEDGARVDLKEHARALMRAAEADLDTKLEWAAIDHHNTDNPHVHILLRGRDERGEALTIDRDYVREGFRRRGQEILTRTLGLRLDRTILRARERAIERPGYTELDRAIIARAEPSGRVTYEADPPGSPLREEKRRQELRRLAALSVMGFAERVGTLTWQLHPGLESGLRQFQLSTDVVKAKARHQLLISDPRAPLRLTRLEPEEILTGRVIGTGLEDEQRDRRYILLEGTNGVVHYVEQTTPIERARGRGQLRVGHVVTVAGTGTTQDHGRFQDFRKRTLLPSTPLDRDALRAIEEHASVATSPTAPATFAGDWGRALAERVVILQRAGLIAPAGAGGGEGAYRALPRSREKVEALMKLNERDLPTLQEIRQSSGKPLRAVAPAPGLQLRGRLIGYAEDEQGGTHAVLDTGGELLALRTSEREVEGENDVRARVQEVEQEANMRRLLLWRIVAEQELERSR